VGFVRFFGLVLAIGMGVAIPVVFLMYMKQKMGLPSLQRHRGDPDNVEMRELRDRVAELEDVQRRLAEVEERLDFT
jgi:hypothetical protein